jgi:raffinose/stachyose/melibiose transport system permease protein
MSRTAHERRLRRIAVPYVAPALLLYTALFLAPSMYSLFASFTDWNGVDDPRFTGFENSVRLAQDPVFLRAFANTVVITVGVGVVLFALSFFFLVFLRQIRGQRFLRGLLFLPHIVSSIVLAIFWAFLFRYDGLINAVLQAFGVPHVTWMGPDTAFWLILVAIIWLSLGYYVTIMMAGVESIPLHYYEAALLDGAGPFQRFRHVTLPLAWDVITVTAVLWTISSVKLFEFIITFGGAQQTLPDPNMWNSALFVYAKTLGGISPAFRFGYASAAAVVTLLFVGLVVVLLRRLMRRETIQF